MRNTNNFNLTIPEGSDNVNILTQITPNFESIDGIMKDNENAGVQVATVLYSNNIHAITRTKYDASVMIYDLLIDRVPNKAKYYADRGKYKKEAGDLTGYENDIKQAKELYPFVDTNSSVTYESIHPKFLDMSIITYTHQNNKGYSTI